MPEPLAALLHALLDKEQRNRPTLDQAVSVLAARLPAKPEAPLPASPEPATSAGPLRFGDYEVARLIGEGASGQVYEAFNAKENRRAAIKVLRPPVGQDAGYAARFLDEVRAANLVNHPGIVTILQASQTAEGRPFIVMEYLGEDTLRARLLRGPQPESVARRIAWQLALALSAAHERGVIHRDLKPENVILVPDPALPGGERVKLLDFGIAKAGLRAPTGLGTPAYLPPEQLRDPTNANDRADVYALGVMLQEMIQGNLQQGPSARLCAPHIAQLLSRMRAEAPQERPSMREVAALLEERERMKQRPKLGLLLGLGLAVVAALGAGAYVLVGFGRTPNPVAQDEGGGGDEQVLRPLAPAPKGMVAIAGGTFRMGSTVNEFDPLREVTILPFALDADEVTSGDFAAWLTGLTQAGRAITVEGGRRVSMDGVLVANLDPKLSGIRYDGKQFSADPAARDKPMVLLSYDAAALYCKAKKRRLPQENEWELAARGAKLARAYPWGDAAPQCTDVVYGRQAGGACAASAGGLGVVGSRSGGTRKDLTPEGVYDLGGNAAEWVVSRGVTPDATGRSSSHVIRGGDWARPAEACATRSRIEVPAREVLGNVGFRCVKTLQSQE